MPLRSMTGFAQVRGQAGDAAFLLALKSVNHRFLDLHLRLPAETDALEIRLRRLLKQRLARGHVELTLTFESPAAGAAVSFNHALVAGYVSAFRAAAAEFGLAAEPDLNVILRMPGALAAGNAGMDEDSALQSAILAGVEEAVVRLNAMREEEGRGIERELRERIARLKAATEEIGKLRGVVLKANLERVQARLKELIGNHGDPDRMLQEAALMAERTDIQEEIVRMTNHLEHFLGLLAAGGEAGKKLDFLLQEMNRETNTLLSKTNGVAGEALRLTELGLAMKSEVEKLREQVQNLE